MSGYQAIALPSTKQIVATIGNPNIVKAKLIYAKVLHSELISFCVTAPTSLTWCKTNLAISIQSFFCLHNKYTAKLVASREIITVNEQENVHAVILRKEIFVCVYFPCYDAFLANQKFLLVCVAVNKLFLII